jgi:hypothetical protein
VSTTVYAGELCATHCGKQIVAVGSDLFEDERFIAEVNHREALSRKARKRRGEGGETVYVLTRGHDGPNRLVLDVRTPVTVRVR